MRAEVTLFGRMIFRIDEDRVVRTSRHAGLTADADRLVKIYDAVCALEHRRGWTSGHTRRVRTLITARYLMRATDLRKYADIDVLDVRARDADGNDVFRFACGRAGVTADATCVVDDLRPLDALVATWLWIDHLPEAKAWRAL